MSDGDAAAHRFPGMEGVEYCPVSIAAKLVGDRWTLLIVRELMDGPRRFNEIHRGLPGLSKSLLSSRLRALVRQGLVEHPDGAAAAAYRLTPAGADLRDVILGLGTWTVRWRFPPPPTSGADSALLLWRIYQGVNADRLPAQRVTIEFVFVDAEPGRGWLILDGSETSLCMEPPGHAPDLVVRASAAAWLAFWFGHRTYADLVASGDLVPDGEPHLVSQLPRWFDTSPFAPAVAARQPTADAPPGG